MFDWLRLTHFSTYAAFGVWGAAGFMSQPTVASLVVHFVVVPPALALVIWLAHSEGKRSARR